jgi:type VI secretion system protein ImpA
VDLDKLLEDISPESPAGEDVGGELWELETLSKGKPGQELGSVNIAAEEPDWRVLSEKAAAILGRGKHLLAAIHLTDAESHLRGLAGLAEGLQLLGGLVGNYWESLYPLLDPEDPDEPNDPTERLNILRGLEDMDGILGAIRHHPLVRVRGLGEYSLRDMELASGRLQPLPDEKDGMPQLSEIEAAFAAAEKEALQNTSSDAQQADKALTGLTRALAETVGLQRAPDFPQLRKNLHAINELLAGQIRKRVESAENTEGAPTMNSIAADGGGAEATTPTMPGGSITSREDALRALDAVCEYFRRTEPSSPVPLLIERAQQLIAKDFVEIIKDLAPNGLAQLEAITGSKKS